MTGHEFSEVDIDLLADYVGGALDGTPDEAVVSALVADDAAWRTAHETLTLGMTAVGADLRAWGAEPLTMPDDVVARLTVALTDHPAAPPLHAVPDLDPTTADGPVADTPATADGPVAAPRPVPASRRGAGRRRPARWAARWAAPVAAAAGVLAFVGFGVQQLWGAAGGQADQATSNAGAREAAPMLASDPPAQERAGSGSAARAGLLAAVPPPERVTSSNLDYDRASLGGVEKFLSESSPQNPRPAAGGSTAPYGADADRSGLLDDEALRSCLQAIAVELGRGPIAVDAVDHARFDGSPALIVRLTAADGRWVWASGPACGSPPAGADTRYRVKVG